MSNRSCDIASQCPGEPNYPPGVKRLPGGGFCYEITTDYDPETGKGRLVTPDSGSIRITPFGPGHHQDDEDSAPNE